MANQALITIGRSRPSAVALASLGVVGLASLVLLGWVFNLPLLTSVLPGLPPMRPITALTFLLAGGSLWWQGGPPGGCWTVLARFSAGGVVFIALSTLAEYLLVATLGHEIDLFGHISSRLGTLLSARMSPHSAVSFLLAGAALWRLDDTRESAIRQVQLLAAASFFIAVLALVGYTYQATLFYSISSQPGLSLPTALAFIGLNIGILACHPERGWMALVSSESAGGLILRCLLPTAVGLPLLLGWLRMLGQHAGWYDTAFGTALMVAANILLLTGILWRQAQALQALDDARAQAEAALQRTNQALEQRVLERTAELSRAREYWRQIVSSLGEAVLVTDRAGQITFLNPVAEGLTGWTLATAVGRPLVQILPLGTDASGQAAENSLDLVLQGILVRGEQLPDREICVPDRQKPDECRYWRMSSSPVRLHDGTMAGAVIILRDISEHLQSEAARRASEEHLRLAMAVGRMGSWDWNVLTGRVEWSTGHFKLLGLSPGEVEPSYENFVRHVHSEDREWVEALLRDAMAAHGEYLADFRVVWSDGSIHWMAGRGRYDYNAAGQCTRMIGVMVDITDRKQAEEELRFSRNRLQFVLNAAGIGLWLNTMPLDDLTWDDRTRELFFVPPGTEPTIELFWSRLHPDDREPTRLAVEAALRDHSRYAIDHRAINPDTGEVRWIRSMGQATYGPNGTPIRFDGINYDITDRKNAEEALHEADRRKNEFLAILAHELRNPLAPIRNTVRILNLKGSPDPTLQAAREMIDRNVEHLVRLIDDLLDLSRITRDKLELRREQVELGTILEHALEATQPHLARAGHHLTVSLPPSPLYLEADPVRLMQVFQNLLSNACKYTETGGRIWLTAERDGTDVVVVKVKDTGIGLAPEHLPHLFEMFWQVAPGSAQSQGGLGLGLALTRGLVEMHGGHIEAHSAGLGQGSEFIVRLPGVTETPASLPSPESPDSHPALATHRLLVVDDNHDAADSLGFLLESLDAAVHIVYDGPAALEALPIFKPTVVLLDLGMPGMDGYEVARRIRRQPEFQQITLIALTGWGQEEDRRRARQAGFDHHLVKPVDITVLQTLLNSLVERQL